jgi:hypothetical protein
LQRRKETPNTVSQAFQFQAFKPCGTNRLHQNSDE